MNIFSIQSFKKAVGESEIFAGVDCFGAKFFLNSEQLVIFS